VFNPWEQLITGWSSFQSVAHELTEHFRSRQLVWRGARRAEWGIESSLYRALRSANGNLPPTETAMVRAEAKILETARNDWRFDNLPAMETMAHLQHVGAPTRLLDVSENPLIALWFAVEQQDADDDVDGRLFAFMTFEKQIRLNSNWGGRHLHWHLLTENGARVRERWGTGTQRKLWRPPPFDPRISAQNAAFLVDGAPVAGPNADLCRREPYSPESWTLDDIRNVASINFKMSGTGKEIRDSSAPVFTFRIACDAKKEIRNELEWRYGYRASSIYPDMYGLASYLRSTSAQLLTDLG
jgi:hypothetical protein